MNYLLAKVKRRPELFKVLSSANEIYDLPDLNDTEAYSPNTLLSDSQWYRIEDFSNTGYSNNFLMNPFSSANHTQIISAQVPSITYLCAIQGGNYFFQLIGSGQLIRKRWFSLDELSIESDKPIITLNKYPDVLFNKVNDTLYFRKLSSATSIFQGMDQLYRAATDGETQAFLAQAFLRMVNNFDHTMVKIPNRKRIALVTATLNSFTMPQKTQIMGYIRGYITVPFVNNAFEIETEEHLKLILYGIEERFYTTPMGNLKRLANSVIELP